MSEKVLPKHGSIYDDDEDDTPVIRPPKSAGNKRANPVESAPEIPQQLTVLEQRITNLASILAKLHERLTPVLRPDEDMPEWDAVKQCTKDLTYTPMGQLLEGSNKTLTEIESGVEMLINHLGI